MTQLEQARNNEVTREMEIVAGLENMNPEQLRKKVAEGKIVIPASKLHKNLNPIGIGKDLKVKVNANIGSSPDKADVNYELEKLKACLRAKTDTVMDLSTGGDIDKIRQAILKNSNIPVGTVPIYLVKCHANQLKRSCDQFLKGIDTFAQKLLLQQAVLVSRWE